MTTQGLQTLNDGPFNLKHLKVSYFGYTINLQLCCHLDNAHFYCASVTYLLCSGLIVPARTKLLP